MPGLLNGQLRHFNNGSASFTPDTLQTHGEYREQLPFILQMGFISRRRGIIKEDFSYEIIEERICINKCSSGNQFYLLTYHKADVSILGPEWWWEDCDGCDISVALTPHYHTLYNIYPHRYQRRPIHIDGLISITSGSLTKLWTLCHPKVLSSLVLRVLSISCSVSVHPHEHRKQTFYNSWKVVFDLKASHDNARNRKWGFRIPIMHYSITPKLWFLKQWLLSLLLMKQQRMYFTWGELNILYFQIMKLFCYRLNSYRSLAGRMTCWEGVDCPFEHDWADVDLCE